MKPTTTSSSITLCLGLALCLPLSAWAAEHTIAEPIVSRNDITWNVLIQHEGLTLSVRGRDCVLAQPFRSGETPRLDPGDFAGERLEDGHYGWELRAVPVVDPAVRRQLEDVRALEDPKAEKMLAMQLRREGRIPWQPITQAGYFTLQDGSIVLDEAEDRATGESQKADAEGGEGPVPSAKTPVQSGDLSIVSSLCVGGGCTSNESFGSDTIRLRENNLRIKLDDNSTLAGFPNRDWQLTANDSAAGGANKFSIEDVTGVRTIFTLEAGAPSHSLFVDDGGRVGLGTSTPSVEAHVVDGDTPTLRLQQDGSSGFAPQTWDVAGNETSFFVRDATNGSVLPFRIFPGASSNSLVIAADSDVGIGTTNPGQKLEVAGGDIKIGRTTGGNTSFFLENTGGTATSSWILRANGTTGGFTFTEAGGNTSFRINTGALTNALTITSTGVDVLGALRVNGMTMTVPDYVFEPTYELLPIAQQGEYMSTHKHLPAVGGAQYDDEGRAMIDLGRNQMGMLEELEKAHLYIQQLHGRLEAKGARIEELAQKNDELEGRLARLESAQR